jgi:hypothetical protein
MIGRIKAILMDPKQEWPRIDAEPATVGGIMTGWAVPLAAIGPIAGLIGTSLFFNSFGGMIARPSMTFLICAAAIGYVFALIGIYVFSLIINALAPTFGGQKDAVQAMKVAAYGATAAWVAGIFQLVPMLSLLSLIGAIYTIYLLYVGLPLLMRVAQDKATAYLITVIVLAIVIQLIINAVAWAIAWRLFMPAMPVIAG